MAAESFRRTVAARLTPLLVAGLLLVLLIADAASGRLAVSWWSTAVAALAVAALAAALLAHGEELRLEDGGIRSRNRYLRRDRFIPWTEIREIRPVHGRAGRRLRLLLVIPHRGPRLILDSFPALDRLEERLQALHRAASAPRL